ncbi:uncharacterized protein F4807DRAFT_411649 [Annulohypoxylon truncatum]|uniref:uncharacterized protein n=1 Tax=Annulohypoxylon truncatum TaxID=327061 RepID=UPI0020075809|nr:uncharacterized protein F4807DRAFT_411649 [Annulohypoxylon truncatum]KAI1213571.1 hypothetical protein F4807DRAFT_411649 [Annulohypoxylon truncatum]
MSNNSRAVGRPALQDASNRVNQTPILPPPNPYLTKAAASQPPAPAPAPATAASTTAPKPTNSKKRKSATSLDDDIAAYKRSLDIDTDGMAMDKTCKQVRALINKLLDNGIMKKTEFCAAVGCRPVNLNTFLSKSGSMDGQFSNVYDGAWAWFKQRELAGLKMPDVKRRRTAEANAAARAAASTSGAASGPGSRGASRAMAPSTPVVDISNVHLPGEETDEVPVYDTCDEIRKKITKHLQTPGVTAAQFCRDIYAQLSHPSIKPFQSKQLNDFRNKKGPNAGCMSKVFYAAYVYFEKKRIAEGKPKSQHRLNMERIWADKGGFDLEHDDRCGVWVGPGETFTVDQYGQLHFHQR